MQLTEHDILELLAANRDSSMLMISILVTITFGYIAAYSLALKEQGLLLRVSVFFTAATAFVFVIINFGVSLRDEIYALKADLIDLKSTGVELSHSAALVINPCDRPYFDLSILNSSLFVINGGCALDDKLYNLSDSLTLFFWIVLLGVTIVNPFRERR